ncbi:MAG: septum formation initiator family protein [Candidatus Doudnabacteria bacterium]|nr:septum formation initiator family protein [Candidatus Doudnabacteria bacterium]
MQIKSIFKSKFATVGLGLVLLLILAASTKLFLQKYEVEQEIEDLQGQAEQISGDNDRLSELIKYYKTDEYAERAAREKLNLKREGEFAVSLPLNFENDASAASETEKTNPQKWYDYFF